MVELWLLLVVFGGSLFALIFQGVAIVLALDMPNLGPAPAAGPNALPTVSVVIAARNEERDLPGCLDDLLAQDYPNLEIVVVDGASTDRTGEVAKARARRVRLVEESPVPDGWVGKNWACEIGSRETRGEWILFTDADLRYHPTAVRATVEWAEREHADLATLAPRIVAAGFWERVVMPFYAQMVLTYFRTPRVNRATSKAAMANGQYTLVRRGPYERLGGHRAIRSSVLEDVRLALLYRKAGLTLRVAWAPDLISTEMYRDRSEMFEGLLKNVHGLRFSAARQAAFLAGLVAFFWLPLAVLPVALLWGSPILALWGAVLYLALFGKHVAFARGLRLNAWYGLAFPIAVGYYAVLVATSVGRGIRGRSVVWKGRAYPLER
ncbi:MAG: glycosyltransferase [Thermoplasmata archaeon]|nr:glycosyltransferase [Thermoplasmata archaeon]